MIVGVDTNAWSDQPLHAATEQMDPIWEEQDNFTGRTPRHGLRDVFRSLVDRDEARAGLLASMRPDGPLAVTFIRRPHDRPRNIVAREGSAFGLDRMDRLYVSEHFEPRACEHFYHDAVDAGGDHALVAAELSDPRD